jgi:hypothetical protein
LKERGQSHCRCPCNTGDVTTEQLAIKIANPRPIILMLKDLQQTFFDLFIT